MAMEWDRAMGYGVGQGHGLERLVLRQYRYRLRSLLV